MRFPSFTSVHTAPRLISSFPNGSGTYGSIIVQRTLFFMLRKNALPTQRKDMFWLHWLWSETPCVWQGLALAALPKRTPPSPGAAWHEGGC